nr:hypothetical protein [uncultured Shimia sp.]
MVFDLKRFLELQALLNGLEMSVRFIEGQRSSNPDPVTSNLSVGTITRDFEVIIDALGNLGLTNSQQSLRRVAKGYRNISAKDQNSWEAQNIANDIRELRNNLFTDFSSVRCVILPRESAALHSPEHPLFGRTVDEAFPSASREISEAGKCLAFELHTACVVHLMRALETPLRVLAIRLGEDSKTENWNTLLNRLEKKVRGGGRNGQSATFNKDQQATYAEAISLLFNIKNAWRNHAAHADHIYNEMEARTVFETTKGFMVHLASFLSEDTAS